MALLCKVAYGQEGHTLEGDERWRVIAKRGYGQRKGGSPMAKNYAITAIRQSLAEAHSSVTPGQDAKRTQPGGLGEQRESALIAEV